MTTRTIADILATAKPRETTVRLCLRGDLVAEFEALDAELTDKTVSGTWRTSDPQSEAADLADRIEALRAEMDVDTVVFRFRSLPRLQWEALVDAHPGRDGRDEPFNFTTFPLALIAACAFDPAMTDAEATDLLDILNEGQRIKLFDACYTVNQESTAVPFSVSASAVSRWREQNSKPLEPGVSPEASS
jgi:hypothetical protein